MINKDLNLILDLDFTIILTQEFPILRLSDNNMEYLRNDPNYLLDFNNENNICFTFVRNGLIKFLEKANDYFNIYVFTAGNFTYANMIVNKINSFFKSNVITYPNNKFQKKDNDIIIKFWHKDHLIDNKKQLSITGLNPEKTFIIDDNVDVWTHALYKIKPFNLLYFLNENNQLLKMVEIDYELDYIFNEILIDLSLVF